MSLNNPYQTYQQNTVNTASPGELTLMLYNGCIKFIKQGKQGILDRDYQEKNTNLIKAQNIIQELMITLNMDYEVAQQLMQMYDYIVRRLAEANMQNNIEILDEVEELVVQFRDTWKQVIQINRKKQYGQG